MWKFSRILCPHVNSVVKWSRSCVSSWDPTTYPPWRWPSLVECDQPAGSQCSSTLSIHGCHIKAPFVVHSKITTTRNKKMPWAREASTCHIGSSVPAHCSLCMESRDEKAPPYQEGDFGKQEHRSQCWLGANAFGTQELPRTDFK